MLCRFPACKKDADTHFALVPLCTAHRDAIQEEADDYYNPSRTRSETSERKHRRLYKKIESQIPWSKKRMGQLPRSGERSKRMILTLTWCLGRSFTTMARS